MGLIVSKYDDDNRIEHCWYDSSNVVYSKLHDKLNELKDLEIVFSDGRKYLYENVKVQDYILFKKSTSQGKDLFKYIAAKGRYEYRKLENTNIEELTKEKTILIESLLNKNDK